MERERVYRARPERTRGVETLTPRELLDLARATATWMRETPEYADDTLRGFVLKATAYERDRILRRGAYYGLVEELIEWGIKLARMPEPEE